LARRTGFTEKRIVKAVEWLVEQRKLSRSDAGLSNSFAIEVLNGRESTSKVMRENGKLGGEKSAAKRQMKSINDATKSLKQDKAKSKPPPTILDSHLDLDSEVKKSVGVRADARSKNRGSRIDPEWKPSDADKNFAKQEGFNDFEIHREANKFKDYWMACAGAKGIKLDWPATWRQWIRRAAEQAGKRPRQNPSDTVSTKGFYAESDSEQLDAWDLHTIKTTGKGLPRDRNFGWRVPSEWPPGYGELSLKNEDENAA
jgi:hypothetical protein